MTNLKRILSVLSLAALALIGGETASAQINTLLGPSLSSAITASQQNFQLSSVTGITASLSVSTVLFIDKEEMLVNSVATPTTTSVTVQRGYAGTMAVAHINAAVVLAGRPDWFYRYDPTGACTASVTNTTPFVNTANGNQWLCSTVTLSWVPGWGNDMASVGVTAAVASAAGQITPSGPLFEVSGTAAITGFLYPIGIGAGMAAGGFCMIPTGTFTTTATNNIAVASTAVVGKLLCETWDLGQAKFVASY
jgi:hypothetical protein